jgi:hypothetical protein
MDSAGGRADGRGGEEADRRRRLVRRVSGAAEALGGGEDICVAEPKPPVEKDYERDVVMSEGFVYLGMARLMLRRLASSAA